MVARDVSEERRRVPVTVAFDHARAVGFVVVDPKVLPPGYDWVLVPAGTVEPDGTFRLREVSLVLDRDYGTYLSQQR